MDEFIKELLIIEPIHEGNKGDIFCVERLGGCVDKISTRQLIWEAVKDKVLFFCDGRMSAEVLRVITACDKRSRTYYPQILFVPEQAYAGACTAKSTIYCANIATGFMLAQFTKHLRMLPVDSDMQINLLALELNVGSY
ncbi:MAG: hypothetical protein ABFD79_12720 [Phycisphaerales bacterium]